MDHVKNKIAIVTGGALGIGRSACILLAREGAQVAVTDVLDDAGERLVKEIQASTGSAAFWYLHVSSETAVTEGLPRGSRKVWGNPCAGEQRWHSGRKQTHARNH